MSVFALINMLFFAVFVVVAFATSEGEVHRLKYYLMLTVFVTMLAMDIHSL